MGTWKINECKMEKNITYTFREFAHLKYKALAVGWFIVVARQANRNKKTYSSLRFIIISRV
jgi:hypothetical protein